MTIRLLSYGTEEETVYNPLIKVGTKYHIMTRTPGNRVIKDQSSFIMEEPLIPGRLLQVKAYHKFPMLKPPLIFSTMAQLIAHLKIKDREMRLETLSLTP